jgi:hypothetical protein
MMVVTIRRNKFRNEYARRNTFRDEYALCIQVPEKKGAECWPHNPSRQLGKKYTAPRIPASDGAPRRTQSAKY